MGPHTLETESRLQFDHAAGETRGSLTEAKVPYVGAGTEETKRREIQLIEDIEEVRAQLELRSFAEMREIRQAELLYRAHIDGEVAWAPKYIAPDARQRVHVLGRVEVSGPPSREISAGASKRVVTRVGQIAAEIPNRAARANELIAGRSDAISNQGCPGESGMGRENSVQLPAAQQFANRILSVPEDG